MVGVGPIEMTEDTSIFVASPLSISAKSRMERSK